MRCAAAALEFAYVREKGKREGGGQRRGARGHGRAAAAS